MNSSIVVYIPNCSLYSCINCWNERDFGLYLDSGAELIAFILNALLLYISRGLARVLDSISILHISDMY